jgi:uncharacterized protein YbcC (UPF0753/DUF2309 family)
LLFYLEPFWSLKVPIWYDLFRVCIFNARFSIYHRRERNFGQHWEQDQFWVVSSNISQYEHIFQNGVKANIERVLVAFKGFSQYTDWRTKKFGKIYKNLATKSHSRW